MAVKFGFDISTVNTMSKLIAKQTLALMALLPHKAGEHLTASIGIGTRACDTLSWRWHSSFMELQVNQGTLTCSFLLFSSFFIFDGVRLRSLVS